MHLKLMLPTAILVDAPVLKVVAEAGDGAFCLLPRHVDFVAALVPGILSYTDADGAQHLLAVDQGTLVKCGPAVLVSTHDAVAGTDLESLRATVSERFRRLDEHERLTRTALARLEAGALRRFMDQEESGRD